MPANNRRTRLTADRPLDQRVRDALVWLERRGSRRVHQQMASRFGIHVARAHGVPMGAIQQLAKRLGRDHDLAQALWETGWYEARLLAAYVADPGKMTSARMDRWARDFDNWGTVDTVCFVLFDRTPHAWSKIAQWSGRKEEFIKRAGFVLLACLALHDRSASDPPFRRSLRLIRREAGDDRNFVKKAVLWALRGVGGRSGELNAAAIETATALAEADEPSARWIGRTALRELRSPATRKRLATKTRRKGTPL